MTSESYNQIPYESLALKQTHPQHLHTLGTLYGIQPQPVTKAKVLELGCASGGNLIPMAYHCPTTQFIGIDFSAKQIDMGNQQVKDLTLSNLTLRHQSILEFNDQEKFDYIICHGLYSWVEKSVRDKILKICHDNLSKNGIAYVSYNTFPGWHIGNTVREMMLLYTKNIHGSLAKAQAARSFLSNLLLELNNENTSYAALLSDEIKLILEHSDSQIIHEHLSDINNPLYLYQFMDQAHRYQLCFLADAYLSNMVNPPFLPMEEPHETHMIKLCQQFDFIKNRRFRCTLLCHQNLPIHYMMDEKDFQQPYLHSSFYLEDDPLKVSAKPIACPLARYQAQVQDQVTNHRHENIRLTPVAEVLLPYLDGCNDIAALVSLIEFYINDGTLVILNKHHQIIQNENERINQIKAICQDTLTLLSKQALLVTEPSICINH
ncbi:MAG: methyltransferase domain-containing protein [Candidatus Berkiellales bacterium]